MKELKKIITGAILLCLILSLTVIASATEVYTAKQVDTFTGEVIDEETGATRIKVTDGCYYDKETSMFTYYLMDNQNNKFESSVPSGIMTRETVSVVCDSTLEPQLYKNNTLLENPNLEAITEKGSYALIVTDCTGQERTELTFTIVGNSYGQSDSYTLPTGFSFKDVVFSGGEASYTSDTIDISQEGDYVMTYKNTKIDKTYTLELTVDKTPPTLALAELKKGAANGPVDISDLEEGATCVITLNGDTDVEYTETLTQSGDYRIIVTDEAGNSTEYNFTIYIYFNSSAWAFILVVIGCAAAVVGYVFYTKKSFKAS